MIFTLDYVEHATLRDGTPVVLRLLAPEDKELLRRGFERLSPESRYARFFVPKQRLTDEELRYLCEIDQQRHFAIGAIREDGDGAGNPIGLGIGRFVRLPDEPGQPSTAEAAVAVIDEVQHQGLGRLLLLRLVAAAAERGIERFRCHLLCSNSGMKALIDTLAPAQTIEIGSGVMSIDFALPAADDPSSPLYRFFREAARGALLPLRDGRDAQPRDGG
ncbi:MAG TPA: GNAT family N-acetyltransferase [Kofleriaceae bacterium]|nr:GNAT family N-acetyltransferase [Kofleriaceae bacterium]